MVQDAINDLQNDIKNEMFWYQKAILINSFDEQQKDSSHKMLKSKQMLQTLTMAFAQVKPNNASENFVNDICQIIYSFYRAKI